VTTTRLGYYLQCRLFNELVCIGANVSRLARLSMRLHTAAADSSGTALRRLSLNSSASLQGSSSCCQRFLKTATSGTHEVTQVTGATTGKARWLTRTTLPGLLTENFSPSRRGGSGRFTQVALVSLEVIVESVGVIHDPYPGQRNEYH
jgi:hypothetical protein